VNVEVYDIRALRNDGDLRIVLAYVMARDLQDPRHTSLDARPSPDELIPLGLEAIAVEVDRAILSADSQAIASKV
jgi:hypothetical protein